MSFRFFTVPIQDGGQAAGELNAFLSSHRVLAVDRRWVDQGPASFWSFCADYLEATGHGPPEGRYHGSRQKVDYKEVLSPEQFAVFARLRDLRKEIAQADRYPDIRRRSVIELAERCSYWPDHSNQVSRLAIALFDQTRAVHGLTDREREWLEYAAILHDLGVLISYEQHHQHSYYLIRNGDLRGFEPDEIETISLIARYHRRRTPKRKHDGFGELRRRRRRTVRTLAAILRLAESLDRIHAQTVSSLELHDRGDDDLLRLRTSGDVELAAAAVRKPRDVGDVNG